MATNIDKIIVNTNRTKATIFYINRSPVNLYSDIGQVLTLLDFIIAPLGYNSYVKYLRRLKSSQEDTQPIDLIKIA